MIFEYSALEIRQTPESDPFYAISVKADELLQWADVPRKKSDFMAGYQRELLDRYKNITEFIQQDPTHNVIPGAVIVSTTPGAISISSTDVKGIFRISITQKEQKPSSLIEQLAESFYNRLSEEEKASIATDSPVAEKDNYEGEEDEAETIEDSPPDSYLASLTKELREAATNPSNLSAERRQAVNEYVQGVSKPGFILDGQHRVFGAKDVSEFDVYLPVILMPGLSTDEQVFHFYVLNNKARPLSPTELRATISTSLTNKEINELYDRFKQAGVTAEEARWTYRANMDAGSPFRGLIDFGLLGDTAFIPENVMYQVIGKFVKLPRKYNLLTSEVQKWLKDPYYDYRLNMFYSFWNAVRDAYPDAWKDGVENKGKRSSDSPAGQLFYKAAMLVLQEYVLNKMNSDMPLRKAKENSSPLSDSAELEQAVKAALYFIGQEFYTRPWRVKGLDTKSGREFLLQQMVECEQRAGQKIGFLQIFRQA